MERNVEDQLFKDLRNSLERRMILKNKLKSTEWQTKALTNEGKGEMGNTLTSTKLKTVVCHQKKKNVSQTEAIVEDTVKIIVEVSTEEVVTKTRQE